MRYVPSDGWEVGVLACTDRLFVQRLGPEITADAKRYCPVFGGQNSTATDVSLAAMPDDYEPGALRDSIEFYLRIHTLIVRASGSSDRSYAYFVETGHNVVAWGYVMGYKKPAQPFLRPSLYQVRLGA